MNRVEILDGLKKVLETIRTVDGKKLETMTEEHDLIKDLGLPSTELINIVVKLEEMFNVEFSDDDIDSLSGNIGECVDLIEDSMKAARL